MAMVHALANAQSVVNSNSNSGGGGSSVVADSSSVTLAATPSTAPATAPSTAATTGDAPAPPVNGSTTDTAAVASEGGEGVSEEADDQPVIDIAINNVVAAFSVRCHLDLKYIALNGDNVEYRRENGMVTMKMRNPYTTASLWSSGKVTCTGATSEADARVGARRVARYLQTRLKFRTQFANYRVVNVLGTCNMPFAIRIADFSQKHPRLACYEPELHPGVTFRIADIRATLKIFSTGSMTVTAPSVSNVRLAIEHIFPLVHEFRKEKTSQDLELCRRLLARRGERGVGHRDRDEDDELSEEEDEEEVEDQCHNARAVGNGSGVQHENNWQRQVAAPVSQKRARLSLM